MTESGAEKRRGFWEERHALSAFIVRALMTFLGTVGALGCIMSSLGFYDTNMIALDVRSTGTVRSKRYLVPM